MPYLRVSELTIQGVSTKFLNRVSSCVNTSNRSEFRDFRQDIRLWIEAAPNFGPSSRSARWAVRETEFSSSVEITFDSGFLPYFGKEEFPSIRAKGIVTVEELVRTRMDRVDLILLQFRELPGQFVDLYFQQWSQKWDNDRGDRVLKLYGPQYERPRPQSFESGTEREIQRSQQELQSRMEREAQMYREKQNPPSMYGTPLQEQLAWELRAPDAQQAIIESLKQQIVSLKKNTSLPSKSVAVVPPSRKRLIELE